ncbi:MAG: hypothetical protein ACYDCC_07700 [Actinomycetota bacterium]
MKKRFARRLAGVLVVSVALFVPSAAGAATGAATIPSCTPASTVGGACVYPDGSILLSLGARTHETGAGLQASEAPPKSCNDTCGGHGAINEGSFALFSPLGTLMSVNFDGVNLTCAVCYEHFGVVGPPPPPVPLGQVSACVNVSYRPPVFSQPGVPSVTRC